MRYDKHPKLAWKAKQYQALSYVWGDPIEIKSIQVNNQGFGVTTNLFNGLQRLRSKTKNRIIWVDAICINQEDLQEKSFQVKLMQEVYSRAKAVLMWLGELETQDFQAPRLPSSALQALRPVEVLLGLVDSNKTDQSEPLFWTNPRFETVDGLDLQPAIGIAGSFLLTIYFCALIAYSCYKNDGDKTHIGEFLDWMQLKRTGNDEGATNVPYSSFKQGIVDKVNDTMKAAYLVQDAVASMRSGPIQEIFDWSDDSQIHVYPERPLPPTEWPVLGAFSAIYSMHQGYHLTELPFSFDQRSFQMPKVSEFSIPKLVQYYAKCLGGVFTWLRVSATLERILTLPYWNRAWIVQEVTLTDDAILHYGNHVMPLEMLHRAQQHLYKHYETCCASEVAELGDKEIPSDYPPVKNFLNLARNKRHGQSPVAVDSDGLQPLETLRGWEPATLFLLNTELWERLRRSFDGISSLCNLRSRREHTPTTLQAALVGAKGKYEATDPRDLVFGFLSLVQDNSKNAIKIDYASSIAEVYARAAIAIEATSSLSLILSLSESRKNRSLRLPSWAPDWRIRSQDLRVQSSSKRPNKCRTGGNLQDDLCFAVKSTKLDRIATVSCACGGLDLPMSENNTTEDRLKDKWDRGHDLAIRQLLLDWRKFVGLPGPSEETADGTFTNREEKFWKTLLSDTLRPETPELAERLNFKSTILQEWWTWLLNKEQNLEIAEINEGLKMVYPFQGSEYSKFTGVFFSIWNQKLFVTEGGNFGLGPGSTNPNFRDMMAGDKVHVVSGCSWPLILRRISFSPSTGKGKIPDRESFAAPLEDCVHQEELVYEFVGLSYIEDLMERDSCETSPEEQGIFIR